MDRGQGRLTVEGAQEEDALADRTMPPAGLILGGAGQQRNRLQGPGHRRAAGQAGAGDVGLALAGPAEHAEQQADADQGADRGDGAGDPEILQVGQRTDGLATRFCAHRHATLFLRFIAATSRTLGDWPSCGWAGPA